MVLQCCKGLVVGDGSDRTVRTNGHIREPRRSVAAYAASGQGVNTEVNMLLEHRPAGVAATAAAPCGIVEGACCAGRRQTGIGEDAIAEVAGDTKDFIVSETRLKSDFSNKVGRRIEGVIRKVGAGRNRR